MFQRIYKVRKDPLKIEKSADLMDQKTFLYYPSVYNPSKLKNKWLETFRLFC